MPFIEYLPTSFDFAQTFQGGGGYHGPQAMVLALVMNGGTAFENKVYFPSLQKAQVVISSAFRLVSPFLFKDKTTVVIEWFTYSSPYFCFVSSLIN